MPAAFIIDRTAKILHQSHHDFVDRVFLWPRRYLDDFLAKVTLENSLEDRHESALYPGAATFMLRALTRHFRGALFQQQWACGSPRGIRFLGHATS